MLQCSCMEVKELFDNVRLDGVTISQRKRTLIVPSKVPATRTRSSASLTIPVIQRSSFFFPSVGRRRLAAFAGHGPTLNDLRSTPDCMLYMWITPLDEAAMPKLPQAVTQTA